MAATLKFYADGTELVGGSGVAFAGANWGASVAVGDYQQTSWISNAAGTANSAQIDNLKFVNTQSGMVNSATSGINVKCFPNSVATLNPRFENDTAVKTQNAQLRIYDRTSINNGASGVTTKVYEIKHFDSTQGHTGSGAAVWTSFGSLSGVLNLGSSPGSGGLDAGGGGNHVSAQHDYYIGLSASPDSIGSKTNYGLYMSLEYL